MDYMFLTEYGIAKSIDEAEDLIKKGGGLQRSCMTVMVLKDFRSKSVWAYPVEGKGVGAAEWLITQVLEDLDTCGLDGCRIVFKSDQDPNILEVQHRIAELQRHGQVKEHLLILLRHEDERQLARLLQHLLLVHDLHC